VSQRHDFSSSAMSPIYLGRCPKPLVKQHKNQEINKTQ